MALDGYFKKIQQRKLYSGERRKNSMGESFIFTPPQATELSLRSQIENLRKVDELVDLGPEEKNFLNNLTSELESKIDSVYSECSSNFSVLQNNDVDEILLQLKKELGEVEAESADLECEIEELQKRNVEEVDKLQSQLEKLCWSLDIEWQKSEKAKEGIDIETFHILDDLVESDSKFKLLELSHQIEKNRTNLKSLQDLDAVFKRFEAVEKIEDSLTGVRVIEIEGNSIRLALKTYIPFLDSVLRQQGIECVIEPLEINHELIIEFIDGTLELNNVEIFPNDVHIDEFINAAKSFRQLYPTFSIIKTRSTLEWFVRKVQERMALSTVRRFVLKNSDNSRHSLEYLNRDDMIVAHMVGGIDAFIKLPEGWPLSNMALKLTSLKSTSHSQEISLSFIGKVVEMANSLNPDLLHNVSFFTNSIEEILMQQMRLELQPNSKRHGE
ncbi:uncharacterized protein LOC127266089 [Andrographis paniculata]|uniref:uncharacterized protein LOC127266089 n=1 Tax=Andrographis paniculata TaxID=175694 RepID=UPI0021E9AD31|nr:uncharacterized protein LOC127266089 [Andrographis paniculata]